MASELLNLSGTTLPTVTAHAIPPVFAAADAVQVNSIEQELQTAMADAQSPDQAMAGGAEAITEDAATPDKQALQRASAKLLHLGGTITSLEKNLWPADKIKPDLNALRFEVERRADGLQMYISKQKPRPRPNNWKIKDAVKWLLLHPLPEEEAGQPTRRRHARRGHLARARSK